MYSQYQSYQQQQPTAAVSTQQQGMIWNGNSWVNVPAAVVPSAAAATTFSTYQQPQQPPAAVAAVAKSNSNNVELYSGYYHSYSALEKETEQLLSRLVGAPQERQEALGRKQWYKYYADLSSRAAYHFLQNPDSQPPFQLPPAPPVRGSNNSSHHQPSTTAATAAVAVAAAAPPPQQLPTPTGGGGSNSNNNNKSKKQAAPGGMKSFVDKCLSQCSNEAEKKEMMKRVEETIKTFVKRGSLHTTNWDQLEPLTPAASGSGGASSHINSSVLITQPSEFSSQNQQQQQLSPHTVNNVVPPPFHNSYNNNDAGHYVPSSSSSAMTTTNHQGKHKSSSRWGSKKKHQQQPVTTADNDNYYGPSSSSAAVYSNNNTTSSSSHKKRKAKDHHSSHHQKLADNDSYYGPSTTSTTSTTTSPSSSYSPSHLSSQQHQYYQSHNNIINKSDSGSFSGGEDFVAVPSSSRHKNKKAKLERKNSGFNQSSSKLGDRAKRFAGPGGNADVAKSNKTAPGFARYMGQACIGGNNKLNDADYENMKVKGTNNTFEKDYLRLTAPPKAELVRPQPILERHLENLKSERKRPDRRDYLWFCSQLKAVRQDCTVQHITNAFCVDVYETHARIALEEGDLNEYNQCQTQLKELYKTLSGKDPKAVQNRNEFIAYRLLYYVFLTGNKKYDGGSSDLFKIMLALTAGERRDPAIMHALSVREAVADTDYHRFFRLLRNCPNLGSHLMDRIVPSIRYKGLMRICKAYRPSVEVEFALVELGFESDPELGLKWLVSCGCIISDDNLTISTKDSVIHESNLEAKKSLI